MRTVAVISGISERTVTATDGVGVVVVTPHGELDLSAIASLDAALRSALNSAVSIARLSAQQAGEHTAQKSAQSQPRLIIDLSEVSVLATVVMGVLLDARRRCRDAGGAISLVVTDPGVESALVDAEVATLFDVAGGLAQALAHLTDH